MERDQGIFPANSELMVVIRQCCFGEGRGQGPQETMTPRARCAGDTWVPLCPAQSAHSVLYPAHSQPDPSRGRTQDGSDLGCSGSECGLGSHSAEQKAHVELVFPVKKGRLQGNARDSGSGHSLLVQERD